jgi:hypothetical protein
MPPEQFPSDHSPSDDALPMDLLGLDAFEMGLLSVLRHFLVAFSQPESQAWQAAFTIAIERWGDATGPQIAAGGLGVLQALRRARRDEFLFANPGCLTCRKLMTGDEAALMQMLQAMRRDRADLARPAVLRLTGGTMDPAMIQSALALAARHPAPADAAFVPLLAPTHPAQRRHLRLVH